MKFVQLLFGIGIILCHITVSTIAFESVDFDLDLKTDKKSVQNEYGLQSYIVQLKGASVVTYGGDLDGYEATKKENNGEKFNGKSKKVRKFRNHLKNKHKQV